VAVSAIRNSVKISVIKKLFVGLARNGAGQSRATSKASPSRCSLPTPVVGGVRHREILLVLVLAGTAALSTRSPSASRSPSSSQWWWSSTPDDPAPIRKGGGAYLVTKTTRHATGLGGGGALLIRLRPHGGGECPRQVWPRSPPRSHALRVPSPDRRVLHRGASPPSPARPARVEAMCLRWPTYLLVISFAGDARVRFRPLDCRMGDAPPPAAWWR